MRVKVAKIVGAADDKAWSQVHEFKPEGEKLKTHGQLVAALAFKAKKEGVEISSFGTEIITRLQEIYYSNESQSILKKLSQTMESLGAEFFNEVELLIVMMVVWNDFLYAGRIGGGQVFLRRDGALVGLLTGKPEEATVVSGKLKEGDELVGGTSQFYRIITEGVLRSALDQVELGQTTESLGAVVHGHEKNSQAAAVLLRLEEEEEIKEEVEKEREEEDERKGLGLIAGKVRKGLREIVTGLEGVVKKALGKRRIGEVRMKQAIGGRKRQRSAATVAMVLVVVFGLSVFLAGRKRQKAKQETEYQVVLEEVRYKYEEAMELKELNPLRAKSLLKDGQERLKSYREEEGELSKELEDWLAKIEGGLNQVQREYELESADEWFDFDLVKEGFRGSDWEVEENELLVWDEEKKTVVLIDLESKASRIVVGGEKVKGGRLVGLAGERGMVVDDDLVTVVEMEDGEVVDEIGADEWGKIVDGVGFGGNLYLLDGVEEGQIWKYLGVKSGLSSKRGYLKGESYDLSEAVSMAIDGSVWVLFSDGTIIKYTRGQKDAFVVAGLDQSFEEPKKIFTSPEVENLYVLDHKQTRVVVISKTGEYKAQYIWPGMAGVKDVVVSEELGKMFLLTGEKVFTIELR